MYVIPDRSIPGSLKAFLLPQIPLKGRLAVRYDCIISDHPNKEELLRIRHENEIAVWVDGVNRIRDNKVKLVLGYQGNTARCGNNVFVL